MARRPRGYGSGVARIMTRVVIPSNLSTPASRSRLKVRPKPHWTALDPGLHLGYRRGSVGGKWCVRIYFGDNYTVTTFSIADDHVAPDGTRVMSYAQARRHALDLASQPAPGPLTVADAIASYFSRLRQKGRRVDGDERRAALHITGKIGTVPVDSLDRAQLDSWLAGVAAGRDHAGATRARRATANRTLTILRAALNQAFKDDLVASDKAWRSCAPFKAVDAPREGFFSQDELHRLLNVTGQTDFGRLVKSALLSGCRYGELTRLRVDDFNPDRGFVHVRESKSGKPRDIFLTAEGVSHFTGLVAGRSGSDLMLTRDGQALSPASQSVPMRLAMKAAHIEGGSFHTLRHCAASWWLMSGVSIEAVSKNLGHATSIITSKVYAHLSQSHRRDEMQKAGLVFGAQEPSTVIPMRTKVDS